jgi:hypothetical protein
MSDETEREIAEKAFELEVHAKMMLALADEIDKQIESISEVHREWLLRVMDNLRRRLNPSIENLTQVRTVLDKERQGRPR